MRYLPLIGLLFLGACEKHHHNSPLAALNPTPAAHALGVWTAAGQSNMARGQVPSYFEKDMQDSGIYERAVVNNVAVGGSYLDEWMPGTAYYTKMKESILANKDVQQGVIWWQGENEGVYGNAGTWAQRFETMITSLRAETGLPTLKVAFVRLNNFNCGPFWSEVRDQQTMVHMPNMTMINIDDIPVEDSAECVHMNPSTPAYAMIADRLSASWK